jgi:hypothetical protein
MQRRFVRYFIAIAVACAPALAAAQSVGISASTQGAGVELGYDISDQVGVRLVGNYFSISDTVRGEDVRYKGDLELLTAGLLADFYLFDSNFHLTGGAYYNGNEVDVRATPTQNVTIGNNVYTPAQLGTLTGHADYRDFAPYAGIGYSGNRFERGWAFIADAGVMFQGGARVTLASNSPVAALPPTFGADLERERQSIKDDIDDLKYFPVVKIGLAYRF